MLDDGASFFVYSFFTQLLGVMMYINYVIWWLFSMFVVHLHWLDAMEGQKIVRQLFVNLSLFAIFNTYVSWTIPFYSQPAHLMRSHIHGYA